MKNLFIFEGDEYEFFSHAYNTTWSNERAIEIPIAARKLKPYLSDTSERWRVLEVGNVLSNYGFRTDHEVVDLYDKTDFVQNIDVTELDRPKSYDFIVSISTLEHVGWDEPQLRDPQKPRVAIDQLMRALAPGGDLLFTIPLGYNPLMDKHLHERDDIRIRYMLRYASSGWAEVSRNAVEGVVYNSPHPCANAIAFCTNG